MNAIDEWCHYSHIHLFALMDEPQHDRSGPALVAQAGIKARMTIGARATTAGKR